jgi:putative NADH-flavin reductase
LKIVVFGATGRTGRLLVDQALAAGYEVTAFVRDPARLGEQQEFLIPFRGDIFDPGRVDRAVTGQDAVLSVLGPANNIRDVMATAAHNITTAMRKRGVYRLIWLTGAGVPDPNDHPNLVDRAFTGMLNLLQTDLLEDSKQAVDIIRTCGLDWTVVRVPRLSDGEPVGTLRVGYAGQGTGLSIKRADAARFMLEALADVSYVRQAPVVSN